MSLEKFFDPKSVAVVGASRQRGKVGHEILTGLLAGGFEGRVFPVNPKAEEIEGLRCYPDLASIGEAPELVIVVVPPPAVPEVMRQCARAGVRNVIVITAGFKEVGEAGRRLEEEIV
ncbi:MAG: hypothetical protein B1H04_06620, partial [Planctomycetales bacterium 4484_123]